MQWLLFLFTFYLPLLASARADEDRKPLFLMSLIPSFNWGDPRSSWLADPGRLVSRVGGVSNEVVQPLAPLMSADLIEQENDYQIHVDIPGVENLEITTEGNYLTITADRNVKHEQDSAVAHTVERSYGKVRRRLLIPSNANADAARAQFRDGVLTVTLPKTEPSAPPKKLTIE